MTRWVERPDRPPHRCVVTLRGQDETGPWLDLGLDYFAPINEGGKLGVSPRLQRLYLCARAIREACEKPGSPYAVLARQEYEALLAELRECYRRIAGLESDLEALRSEREPASSPIDAEALADQLIVRLDDRYRRKPGPAPKGRAA